jgi:hypothetical protein
MPAQQLAPDGTGAVSVRLDSSNLNTSAIARATMTISPGSGSGFVPIIAMMSPEASTIWSASITGVPAGRRRSIDIVAYDAGGLANFRGGATIDVGVGANIPVSIVLLPVSSSEVVVTNPEVSVSLSAAAVTPGGTATVSAEIDGAQPTGSAWYATCGTFANPVSSSTTWTAPDLPNQRCQLTFTASTASSTTSVQLSIDVLADPSTRLVIGRRSESCWQDPSSGLLSSNVVVQTPGDGSIAPPDALVQTSPGVWSRFAGGQLAADGTFTAGSFAADGSWAIVGIPRLSPSLLSFSDASRVLLLVDTSAGGLDLGYDKPGRCDASIAPPGTSTLMQLSGLSPWVSTSSELHAASSGAGLAATLAAGSVIADGASTVSLSVSWSGDPLLVPTDVLWLEQLSVALHPDGLSYRSAVAAAQLVQTSLTGGASNTTAAQLSQVPQTGGLPVQWTPIAFERSLPDLAPPARVAPGVVPPHRLSVVASPFALRYPSPDVSALSLPLATFDEPSQTVSVGLSTPLRYGQFLPAWWAERREVRYAVAVGYQAPGALQPLYEIASIAQDDALPVQPATIAPTLTPVRSPTIGGQSALADQTAVTTTPTFSWTAPSTGIPTVYELDIYSLQAAAGASQATLVVRYLTASSSASLPPGVLAAGGTYFARITAIANDVPTLLAPLRYSPVGARASMLTGTFTP